MSKRWLSGVLIFALGFGCASLVTIAMAQDRPDAGELEEGLRYVNTGEEVRLVNTGREVYVTMVMRKPGTLPAEPFVSYKEGEADFSKLHLDRLRVYRLVPVQELEDLVWLPCTGGVCSWTGPLPPPPPPPDRPDSIDHPDSMDHPDPTVTFLSPEVEQAVTGP